MKFHFSDRSFPIGGKNLLSTYLLVFFIFAGSLSSSSDLQISPDINNITDFRTDRIAFHFIQSVDKEGKILSGTNPNRDSSEATLMIIYKGQLTLLKDGYDDPNQVREREKEYLVKISNYIRLRELESEYRKLPESERTVSPNNTSEKSSGLGAASNTTSVQNSTSRVSSANTSEANQTSDEPLKKTKELDLLLKYDEELLKSYSSERAVSGELERAERLYGKDSPKTSSIRFRAEELRKKLHERKNALISFLKNPGASTNPYPGDRKDQTFYTNAVNGIPDFYLHSTTPRELDGQMKGEEEVGKKYGELYKSARDKLIDSQIRKLYYYLWNREMTNTRVKTDRIKKGKKAVVVAGDSTVFTMIDKEGDGITESFFVDGPGIRFSWGRDLPNIISISNCTDETILLKIKNLTEDVLSGRIPEKVDTIDFTVPEEQLVIEFGPKIPQ
ncbi:hypothetical protein [Leptospira santarosai]|uniref:Uncharacterized protein n=1 Tax=Leptospira santarosai TaxID=28183 RepID=A0AB73MBR4_9LEPT|nr:hypothetical protein [Leptospira santarosai]AVV51695.1 Uncharacterized protein XB17_03123 [Leptospira santarosai]MDI7173696.1 hypothetical protein [Leptospira santarosai]MDI7193361.1 hypothetical protein [Leptospira santarosai]MDO6397747.1 hypothetical protein [Leptospira santarosai]MDO6403200.1 hypothetical protein [Leptospira santarosai]